MCMKPNASRISGCFVGHRLSPLRHNILPATFRKSLCTAQVESVQLASESAHKQLELELANAKHNAAQAAAAHKSAAASWQGELDWQKSEVLPMP